MKGVTVREAQLLAIILDVEGGTATVERPAPDGSIDVYPEQRTGIIEIRNGGELIVEWPASGGEPRPWPLSDESMARLRARHPALLRRMVLEAIAG